MWSCKLVRWYSDAFTCLWLFKLMLELFVLLHTGVNWPLWDIINLPINRLTKASGLLDAIAQLDKGPTSFLKWRSDCCTKLWVQASCWRCRGSFCTHTAVTETRKLPCAVQPDASLRKLSLSPTSGAWQDAVTSVILPVSSSVNLRDWFQWAGAGGGASLSPSSCVFTLKVTEAAPDGVCIIYIWIRSKEWRMMKFARITGLGGRIWKCGGPARVDDESQLLRSHCCKHVYTFPACEAKRLHKLSWKTRGHSCSLQKAIALKVRPADTTSGTTPLCVHAPHSTALTRLHVTAQQKNTVWTELVSETWNTSVCTQRGWSAAPV